MIENNNITNQIKPDNNKKKYIQDDEIEIINIEETSNNTSSEEDNDIFEDIEYKSETNNFIYDNMNDFKNEWCHFKFNNKEISPLTELMDVNNDDWFESFYNKCYFLKNNSYSKIKQSSNNKLNDLNFNSSNLRVQKVTKNIEDRIHKYGALDLEDNIILRKKHNNYKFYEQDDNFIDDGKKIETNNMEILDCEYVEFGTFNGNLNNFKNSIAYKSRQKVNEKKLKKKTKNN